MSRIAKNSINFSENVTCKYENGNFEHVPNTFMYDDVKVNRELVLLMPSTSLGGKMGLGTNQQWDGQWVQVDAIVKRILQGDVTITPEVTR